MKAEEVIVRMAGTAPSLSDVGVRLMLHVVATAIATGSNVVRLTSRTMASSIGIHRRGITPGVRDLKRFIEADVQNRQFTLFRLSGDWYDGQMTLPFDSLVSVRAALLKSCGFGGPGPQMVPGWTQNGTTPGPQMVPATSVLDPKWHHAWTPDGASNVGPGPQMAPAWTPEGSTNTQDDSMPRARVPIESNRIEDGGDANVYLVIEKAFHTVEIFPSQRDDARILSECIHSHRNNFDSVANATSRRDPKVIARLLAIAPIEDLASTIGELQAERRPPGKSDMWYFTVLLDRIHGIDHKQTEAALQRIKAKARPFNQRPGLFEEQLHAEVTGQLRRIV